jgi:PAS domain S-box-containing protein
MKRNWATGLLCAVAVEVALAFIVRSEKLLDLLHGDRQFNTLVGVVGLGWLVVLLAVAVGAAQSLLTAQAGALRGWQVLTGVAGASREWVWEADSQMRLTYSNERVRDLLGYDPAQLYGQPMPDLLVDGQSTAALTVLGAALTDRAGWDDVELLWRHADGHAVPLQGSAAPILDADGAVIGFRGSRRAVSAELNQQRTLAAARERIDRVLTDSALDTALQPIVDLASGRLVGVEALARFRDGRRPDQWFGDARDTGQSLDLDRLAFVTALSTFPQLPPGVYLSVNATPALLTDPRFRSAVVDSGVPLERLVVEITEHVEIFRYEEITAALTPLRERGVRLAIDDTGAGFASFSHVLKLRPDVIKIDRSLIAGVHEDPARRSLITALVLLALDLRAAVTAEGAEQAAELEALLDLGVDHVQGYLLARPTTDRAAWARWWGRNWIPSTSARRPSSPLVPTEPM